MRNSNLVCNRASCSGEKARTFNCWLTEVTSSLGATEVGCLPDLVPIAIADEESVQIKKRQSRACHGVIELHERALAGKLW